MSDVEEERGLTLDEVEELEPGDNIFVHSLVSRPDLNGRMGMVTCGLDTASARVLVQLERELRPIALKPANLELSDLPAGCRHFIGAAHPEALPAAPKTAKARRTGGGDTSAGKRRRKEEPSPPIAAGVENEGEEDAKTPEYDSASGLDLTVAIGEIVRTHDLTTLTARAVREELEVRLELDTGSLAPRKQEVRRLIDAALVLLRSSASSAPAD